LELEEQEDALQSGCDRLDQASWLHDPGFTILGDALVITQIERWHQFRVEGDLDDARERIAHLGMEEKQQVVFKPSGRHRTHQYIYVKSDNDAVAVRLAI
jgi:hypothetical protein